MNTTEDTIELLEELVEELQETKQEAREREELAYAYGFLASRNRGNLWTYDKAAPIQKKAAHTSYQKFRDYYGEPETY